MTGRAQSKTAHRAPDVVMVLARWSYRAVCRGGVAEDGDCRQVASPAAGCAPGSFRSCHADAVPGFSLCREVVYYLVSCRSEFCQAYSTEPSV